MSIAIDFDLREAESTVDLLEASTNVAEFVSYFEANMLLIAHRMQDDAFAGEAGGSSTSLPQKWPALSDWSVRDRGNEGPILVRSGQFKNEVANYEGDLETDSSGLMFLYPSNPSGKYFGLTAGQLRNPLASRTINPGPRGGTSGDNGAPFPLKYVPRPLLFGGVRLFNDANILMAEWFALHGIHMGDEGAGEE